MIKPLNHKSNTACFSTGFAFSMLDVTMSFHAVASSLYTRASSASPFRSQSV